MSLVRDAETERIIAKSRELRAQLADALAELERFTKAMDEYVDRQHQRAAEGDES